MKLVVFYSYGGHTRELVSKIIDKYNYDVVEVESLNPYSEDYNAVVASEEKLVPLDYQPDIKEIDVDFKKYDEIILCSPVWWYSVASPMNTFIHNYNLKNKKVSVMLTNGGYPGRAIENIEKVTGCKLNKTISLTYDKDRLVDTYEFEDFLNSLED